MAATSVRLLLVACFALLVSACAAGNQRDINPTNCKEYLTGDATQDVIILQQIKTMPYQRTSNIDNRDHCYVNHKRLVGALVVACDPLGPPAPSIQALSTLSQTVECHTDGPCLSGLTVTVSQYCARI